ncbi:MAG: beta-eliminating lyase-related protein [Hyphomonadaceae bacterium]|nr:beta-eliminating lyase-related protein [Hyphomonadaceae bacterium]
MNFRSDNTSCAAPEMLAALAQANDAPAAAYGQDSWSLRLDEAFSRLFDRQVRVFTVASGTAANAIALAALTPPWGAVICHREAHIERDECGAPEFYTGGAKLVLTGGAHAKIEKTQLITALDRRGDIHVSEPRALSLSQATERGAVYTPAEISELSDLARAQRMRVHVDGARFANAVAALGCAPADITWRAGVDVLSFGATKNGALGAEAIILFDLELAEEIERRRKRGGHLLCKGRYAAAQLLAYIEEGRWLNWAGRANALAARLGEAAGASLSAPVKTNQVFVRVGQAGIDKLRAAGVDFYNWGPSGSGEARLVVSWNQPEAEVTALAELLQRLA